MKPKRSKKEYDKENYLKNKEMITKAHKEYRLKNKEKVAKAGEEYRLKNKEKITYNKKKYYIKNKDRLANYHRVRSASLRAIVLRFYSGGTPRCSCCNEEEVRFLAIDHIEGGGRKHRKKVGTGGQFYAWIINNNFPPGLQILCHNCNMAKGFYGVCPHKSYEQS